jgi:hypothetical protein
VGTSGGGRRHGCANHSLTPNAAAQRLPRDGPAGHGTRVSTHLENASVDDRMQNPVSTKVVTRARGLIRRIMNGYFIYV